MSLFDPAVRGGGLVELFYDVCTPYFDRPAKISRHHRFKYLMHREELEYHLDSDIEMYGKRNAANPDSRWNTPEFAVCAVDAVRQQSVLQSTKTFWEKTDHTFKQHMRALTGTTDKDLQYFQLNLQKAVLRNTPVTELIGQAKHQGVTAVHHTLQHILMHATNTPMTEGNIVVIRHIGQTMHQRFGSCSSFFTTNFTDTYHVFTQVLTQRGR